MIRHPGIHNFKNILFLTSYSPTLYCTLSVELFYVFLILIDSPYSPDLNPIEEAFSVAKAWLKRHHGCCEKFPMRCFEIALDQVNFNLKIITNKFPVKI